jgi:O-antigen ligase
MSFMLWAKIYKHFEFTVLAVTSVFLIPFFGLNSTIDPVLMPGFLIWAVMSLVLSICLLIRLCTKPEELAFEILNRFIFPVLFCYFLFSLLSLIKAVNITEGIHEVLKNFVFITYIFFASIILARHAKYINILSKMITIAAILLCIIAYYEYARNNFLFESATMANRNLLASAFFLMLPFCLYGLFSFSRLWKIANLILLIFILFCTFSTKARSVFLGLIISTLTLILVFVLFFKNIRFFSFRRSILYFVISLTIIAFIVLPLYGKTQQVKQIWSTETLRERFALWKKTFKLIEENPYLGVGSGNWRIVLPSYSLEGLTPRSFTTDFFQRPHNDYLWVLSENGVLGLVCYLAIFATVITYIFKLLFKLVDFKDKVLIALMLWGIIGYMVDAFFWFPKERIFHSVFLALMISIVVSQYQKSFGQDRKGFNAIGFVLISISIVILSLAIVDGYIRTKAEIHTKKALYARSMGKWKFVIAEIDKGYSAFATLDPMSTPLQWYKGEANFFLNNTAEALENYKKAYKANPYHIHVLNDLASCYELQGRPEQAIYYYQKALKIHPRFENALINLGATYYNCGRYEQALSILLRCDPNSQNPRLEKYIDSVKKALDKNQKHR